VIKIFVSSKIKGDEMKPERESARSVIDEDLEQEAIMWEKLAPAMAKSPDEAYLDGVRASQVYVLIAGAQYSPGSVDEFQEAMRGGKKPLIFIRAAPNREPKQNEFLDKVRKFKYASYSEPTEFPPKLRQSLLALMAEQATMQMQVKAQARAEYAQSYRTEYIRPLFEETNSIAQVLRAKKCEDLPTDAWTRSRASIYMGEDEELDLALENLYSAVASFNQLRTLALYEFKGVAGDTIKTTIPANAEVTQVDQILERLVNHASFFVIRRDQDEDWWRAYDRVVSDLEIPLKNINAATSANVQPRDIINRILGDTGRRKLTALLRSSRSEIDEYNKSFEKLLIRVVPARDKLRDLYSGKL
jgi:hypothetical protein